MSKPIVIVRVDNGYFAGIDFAGEADVFCHDPACASEPVYRMTIQSDADTLRAEVGNGPWPNAEDERHAAIVARFDEEHGEGKPRLSLVPPDKP